MEPPNRTRQPFGAKFLQISDNAAAPVCTGSKLCNTQTSKNNTDRCNAENQCSQKKISSCGHKNIITFKKNPGTNDNPDNHGNSSNQPIVSFNNNLSYRNPVSNSFPSKPLKGNILKLIKSGQGLFRCCPPYSIKLLIPYRQRIISIIHCVITLSGKLGLDVSSTCPS